MHKTMKLALQVICASLVMNSFARAEDTVPAPANTCTFVFAGIGGRFDP